MRLLDNRNIPNSEVRFNPNNYHFYYGAEDITDAIPRADKIFLVPNFDIEEENRRLSKERGAGGNADERSESTFDAFIDQATNRGILAAPLETLDNTVSQVFKSTGIQTLIVLGLLGLGALIYFKAR